jgi:hypothetical protein
MPEELPDRVTLIAISALAYVMAVGLHEHLGHATACVLLGSHATELGAFFVNCDDSLLGSAAVRAVAVAGPLVSLLVGVLCLLALRAVPERSPRAFYFLWLLGTIALMSAAGYPLFSGVAGIGDLGTGSDGALRDVQPEWLWRVALAAFGALSYWGVARLSMRLIAPRLAGSGEPRVRRASRIARLSYITGAVVYLAIGVFNPYGLLIVLESVLPSSLGGTSGLLWMMEALRRQHAGSGPDLDFSRSRGWIAASALVTIGYALVFAAK